MVLEKLKSIVADQLDVEEDAVVLDASITEDLGADSLDVVDLVMSIEEEFDIEIANEEAEKIVTVSDAVEQIKGALN